MCVITRSYITNQSYYQEPSTSVVATDQVGELRRSSSNLGGYYCYYANFSWF